MAKRTYEQILTALTNQYDTIADPRAVGSLNVRDKITFFKGLTDTNKQLDINRATYPWRNDPLMQAMLKRAGPGGGGGAVTAPEPASQQLYLRGPGTELVTITAQTRVDKPFAEPRTLVIDGKEYQMSNIQQATDVKKMIEDAVSNLATSETAAQTAWQAQTKALGTAGEQAVTEQTQEDVTTTAEDAAKRLEIARSRFKTDVTPQIQASLNERGLLESGATPEALARALAGSASQTTEEGVNALMADTMRRYAPLRQSASAAFTRNLGQGAFSQGVGFDALLQALQQEGQTPDMSQTLPYQLGGLGVGAGVGLYQNYRRKKRYNALANLMRQGPSQGFVSPQNYDYNRRGTGEEYYNY